MVVARTLGAFVTRDWHIALSYRLAWFLGLGSTLFELVLFYYLSRLVNVPALDVAPGHAIDYFPFVVIGLAVNNFLLTGIDVFSSSLRTEQTSGTLEVLFSLPTSPWLTLIGIGTYGLGWSFVSTVLLLALAIGLFGLRLTTDPLALAGSLLALAASVALFASLGIVIGAVTLVFKRADAFTGLVMQGLGIFSGVFFPVTVLPEPLQALAQLNPFTWALKVLRQGLLAGDVPAGGLLLVVVAGVVALPVALAVFGRALEYARRKGSLGEY